MMVVHSVLADCVAVDGAGSLFPGSTLRTKTFSEAILDGDEL